MVLFLISSGINIGIGHVKRCIQLASLLNKQNIPILLCLEHDLKSIEIIKNSNLNFITLNQNTSIGNVLRDNPQLKLIVMDMLDVSKKETGQLKAIHPQIKILALDYFDMEDNNVDTIINLCNHNLTHRKSIFSSVKYLEGTKFGILRSEFQEEIEQKKPAKNKLKNILITFGGSDPKQHTLSIIPLLNTITKGWNVFISIIIGPNFLHTNQITEAIQKTELKFEFINNPVNIAKLMSSADVCICGSGTTILELSALGTPALVVPQSKEELRFSKVFESAGFAKIVGDENTINEMQLKESLKDYYENPEKINTASITGPSLCDGKGSERIIEEINILLN